MESVKTFTQPQWMRLEVTTKSVCRLLSDVQLRRSLMAAVLQDETTGAGIGGAATTIISTSNCAAQKLVQLPNKQIARLGLQIARLLIAFIGHSVYVSDIIVSIHNIYNGHKHSLRFIVKAMVEKLLKKVK